MHTAKCKMCGKDLDRWVRSDAQTCSVNCRKQWSRRKDRVQRSYQNIMLELATLRRLVKQHPDLADRINEHLRYVQGEIRDVLLLRDRQEQERIAMLNGLRLRRHR